MTKVSAINITKQFGGAVKGVDDVSLEFAEGSFTTLLGPSGSGKTTTLRMIAGLETPTTGVIRIGDQEVFRHGNNVPTHRRNIGMVFQSYAVWPHMTVADNIGFPLTMKKTRGAAEIRKLVDEIIKLVNLDGLGSRYPAELSGGQQQRVALARALIAQPAVLLFDEPLSNLDAKLRESMRQSIKELHERLKITSIYVTHDQLEAIWLSDVIHVMSRGRIVQSGSPQEIYDAPKSLFVAGFTGQSNVLAVSGSDAANRIVHSNFGADLRLDKWPAEGQPTHILVRYNQTLLGPPGGTALNSVAGRLENIQFVGDRYHVDIVTEGGAHLVAYLDRLDAARERGQAVTVTMPADLIRPLVESANSSEPAQ